MRHGIAAASASVTTNIVRAWERSVRIGKLFFNPANDLQRDGLLSTTMETRATFPQSDRGKVVQRAVRLAEDQARHS